MAILSAKDLITDKSAVRKGFIEFALEKNLRGSLYIAEAKALRHMAQEVRTPEDLLQIKEIRSALLTAAGLSNKTLKYLNEAEQKHAIQELIDKFLKPAGEEFAEELAYRFLLIRGDALGGSLRNLIGNLAQKKLLMTLLAIINIAGLECAWLRKGQKKWVCGSVGDYSNLEQIKGVSWSSTLGKRTL